MGRGEEKSFKCVGASEVEEEEAFEVHGTDLLGNVIGEGGEGEREEMRGGGEGDGVEVVFGCKGVDFEGTGRGMGEEKVEERGRGGDVGENIDAVFFERDDAG